MPPYGLGISDKRLQALQEERRAQQHGGVRLGAGRLPKNRLKNQAYDYKLDSKPLYGTDPAYIRARLERDDHTEILTRLDRDHTALDALSAL